MPSSASVTNRAIEASSSTSRTAGWAGFTLPAQQLAQRLGQLLHELGFVDHARAAQRKGVGLALCRIQRGDHQQLAARELLMRAQGGDEGGAVDVGQQDVHQQHVGLDLPVQRHAGDPVVRHVQLHVGKVALHQQAHQVLEVHGVLDQQHARARAGLRGSGRRGRRWRPGRGGRITLPAAPALHGGARDAPVPPGGLPGLQIAAIDHELNRPHRHAQQLGHLSGRVVRNLAWWGAVLGHGSNFASNTIKKFNTNLMNLIFMIQSNAEPFNCVAKGPP